MDHSRLRLGSSFEVLLISLPQRAQQRTCRTSRRTCYSSAGILRSQPTFLHSEWLFTYHFYTLGISATSALFPSFRWQRACLDSTPNVRALDLLFLGYDMISWFLNSSSTMPCVGTFSVFEHLVRSLDNPLLCQVIPFCIKGLRTITSSALKTLLTGWIGTMGELPLLRHRLVTDYLQSPNVLSIGDDSFHRAPTVFQPYGPERLSHCPVVVSLVDAAPANILVRSLFPYSRWIWQILRFISVPSRCQRALCTSTQHGVSGGTWYGQFFESSI